MDKIIIENLKNQLMQIKNTTIEVENISTFLEDSQIPKGAKIYNVNCSILFVDIRHSTDMTDENGRKSMVKIYKMFAKLVITAVEENGGSVNQIMGDGMLCTFITDKKGNSGDKAINAAVTINTYLNHTYNSIVDNSWTIACGIGIRTGHVYLTRIGIKGYKKCSQVAYPSSITNYACKLCGLAEGGEILFDITTFQHIKSQDLKNSAKNIPVANLGTCKSIKDTIWRIEK